jgi:hypothetical protein
MPLFSNLYQNNQKERERVQALFALPHLHLDLHLSQPLCFAIALLPLAFGFFLY